jgi:hypothetical protein
MNGEIWSTASRPATVLPAQKIAASVNKRLGHS